MKSAPSTPPAPSSAAGPIRILQDLIGRIDALPDPEVRALFEETLRQVMQLHGGGLRRMLELAVSSGDAMTATLTDDPTLRSLLLIHDLHPVPLAGRLDRALAKVLPYIRSHGGNVELVALEDGIARLRLEGTCRTCPSSTLTLELAVRGAIEELCPDLTGFEVEGIEPAAPAAVAPGACVGASAA